MYFLLTLGFILLSEASVLGWDAGVNLKEISFSEINFPVDLFSWILRIFGKPAKICPAKFFLYFCPQKSCFFSTVSLLKKIIVLFNILKY